MSIIKAKLFATAAGFFALFALSQIALESLAEARAGNQRSSGVRGSRSSQSPSRAATPQKQDGMPAQQASQPSPMMPQAGTN